MNTVLICKTVLVALAGIAWCLGHYFGLKDEVTHGIGVAFWLLIILI